MYSFTRVQSNLDQCSAENAIPAKRLQLLLRGDCTVFSQLFDVPILWRLNRAFVPDSGMVLIGVRTAVQKLIQAVVITGLTLTITEILALLNQEIGSAIRDGRDSSRRLELPQMSNLVCGILAELSERNLCAVARSYRSGASPEAIYREMGISAGEFRAIRLRLGSSYAQNHPPRTLAHYESDEAFDYEGELMNAYQALSALRSPSPVVRKAKSELRRAIARIGSESLTVAR